MSLSSAVFSLASFQSSDCLLMTDTRSPSRYRANEEHHASRGPRLVVVGAAAVALIAIGVLVFIVIGRGQDDNGQFADAEQTGSPTATTPADWVFDRANNPARTIVR